MFISTLVSWSAYLLTLVNQHERPASASLDCSLNAFFISSGASSAFIRLRYLAMAAMAFIYNGYDLVSHAMARLDTVICMPIEYFKNMSLFLSHCRMLRFRLRVSVIPDLAMARGHVYGNHSSAPYMWMGRTNWLNNFLERLIGAPLESFSRPYVAFSALLSMIWFMERNVFSALNRKPR